MNATDLQKITRLAHRRGGVPHRTRPAVYWRKTCEHMVRAGFAAVARRCFRPHAFIRIFSVAASCGVMVLKFVMTSANFDVRDFG